MGGQSADNRAIPASGDVFGQSRLKFFLKKHTLSLATPGIEGTFKNAFTGYTTMAPPVAQTPSAEWV